MAIKDYSTVAANNTSVNGVNTAEGCAPSDVNDAMREMMADTRAQWEDAEWFDFGHTITYASATSFTITGMDVTDEYHAGRRVRAVGTTTGTIYGTIESSTFLTDTTVTVTWDSGSLANESLAVSLGILRATNPSLPNSDAARAALGLGSMATQNADSVAITGGSATFTGSVVLESTDGGAAENPIAELYRNSPSPANLDDLGAVHFTGKDSGGGKHTYAAIEASAETVTDGAESGMLRFQTSRSGSVLAARAFVGAGLYMQGTTDPGQGKINAQEYLVNGQPLPSTLEVADAWIRFNGRTVTFTPNSVGVSSLIEQGPSDWQINWSPTPTTNAYAVVACGGIAPSGASVLVWFTAASTTNLRVRTEDNSGVFNEPDAICIAIFGAF